jgi:hypothetical protein
MMYTQVMLISNTNVNPLQTNISLSLQSGNINYFVALMFSFDHDKGLKTSTVHQPIITLHTLLYFLTNRFVCLHTLIFNNILSNISL